MTKSDTVSSHDVLLELTAPSYFVVETWQNETFSDYVGIREKPTVLGDWEEYLEDVQDALELEEEARRYDAEGVAGCERVV